MAEIPERTMLNWTGLQETMSSTKKRAMRALVAEYTSLLREPAEGFVVRVEDPFNWDVGVFGPPSTPYWGGYFKVNVTFPDEYPFEPPKLKFKSRFWHPNVYHNGVVCMSILHDPNLDEIPTGLCKEEKWNPTLSVRTVLLSLISLMGSPNPDSPANPDASKMYRCWIERDDDDYVKIIEDIVRRSKKIAVRDGVSVPKTLDEYLVKPRLQAAEPLLKFTCEYGDDDSASSHSCLSDPTSDSEADIQVESDEFNTRGSSDQDNRNLLTSYDVRTNLQEPNLSDLQIEKRSTKTSCESETDSYIPVMNVSATPDASDTNLESSITFNQTGQQPSQSTLEQRSEQSTTRESIQDNDEFGGNIWDRNSNSVPNYDGLLNIRGNSISAYDLRNDLTQAPFSNNHLIRNGVDSTTNLNILPCTSTSMQSLLSTESNSTPPRSTSGITRKRRRPPPILLYSNNESKKRKKQ